MLRLLLTQNSFILVCAICAQHCLRQGFGITSYAATFAYAKLVYFDVRNMRTALPAAVIWHNKVMLRLLLTQNSFILVCAICAQHCLRQGFGITSYAATFAYAKLVYFDVRNMRTALPAAVIWHNKVMLRLLLTQNSFILVCAICAQHCLRQGLELRRRRTGFAGLERERNSGKHGF